LAHSGIINSPNFNTAADIVPEAVAVHSKAAQLSWI